MSDQIKAQFLGYLLQGETISDLVPRFRKETGMGLRAAFEVLVQLRGEVSKFAVTRLNEENKRRRDMQSLNTFGNYPPIELD